MSRIAFVILYVLAMLPTYILPYFGSNSVLMQTFVAASTRSSLGLTGTVLHIGALVALIYIAWARAQSNGRRIMVALPIVAALFDIVPFLSFIPLVPTVLHVATLVLGIDQKEQPTSVPRLARMSLIVLPTLCVLTVLGAAFIGGAGDAALRASTTGAVATVAASEPAISATALATTLAASSSVARASDSDATAAGQSNPASASGVAESALASNPITSDDASGAPKVPSRLATILIRANADGTTHTVFVNNSKTSISEAIVDQYKTVQVGTREVHIFTLASGGTACAATYSFLIVEEGKATVSEPFGNCNDLPKLSRAGSHVIMEFGQAGDAAPVTVDLDGLQATEGGKPLKMQPVSL